MMQFNEQVRNKWNPVLEHSGMPEIQDDYRKNVTATLLENQQKYLTEAAPANNYGGGNINSWDPILISLVRRAMPNLIAYDVCGVQPMTAPTGLIFALKSHYDSQTGTEALFNEADTSFGGSGGTGGAISTVNGVDPFNSGTTGWGFPGFTGGRSTSEAEALGDSASNPFPEMAISIDKVTVTAKSRALKAEYSLELQQDLKAVHGLDAETELANMLSNEILAEINREVLRTIYRNATLGASRGTDSVGIFNMNTDSNGRWSVERFKGLLFQLEREANEIAKATRRGKGNFIICTADVASALSMAGVLDYAPALSTNLNVDDTGNTFAGVLNGNTRVYIDPYASTTVSYDFFCAGYKGTVPYDAGLFYCPYVPLQMVRAVGENSFQPKIAFKTRYGMVQNPFVSVTDPTGSNAARTNTYYRIVRVDNLM